jgi:hypothetical protein
LVAGAESNGLLRPASAPALLPAVKRLPGFSSHRPRLQYIRVDAKITEA